MKRVLWLIALLSLWPVLAEAQVSVSADRVLLGATPCVLRTGTGTPSGGASCEFFLSTTTGDLWQNVAGVWHIVTTAPIVQTLTATTHVKTPLINADADMTIAPTGDVIFNPTGRDLLPAVNYYTSIGAIGRKFLTLYIGELVAETLVAQDVVSTIGGRVMVAPTTPLTVDVAPASTTITVKHNQMANGNIVYLQSSPGGVPQVEWMQITSGPTTVTDGFRYTVTRNLDGSSANQWYAGDAVLNTGTTGDGFIDMYSQTGVLSGAIGPTLVGNVRTGTAYQNVSPRWALGNLNNVGYGHNSNLYGFAAGVPTGAYLYTDSTNGLVMGGPGGVRVRITPAGVATFVGDGGGVTNINGGNITTQSITATQIAANTITAGQIAAGTITAGQIAANTITGDRIAAGTITGTNIAGNTITGSMIVAGTISGGNIADGTIGTADITPGSITGGLIAAGTIVGGHIAGGTITGSNIAGSTITGGNIAAGAISAGHIQSNSIYSNMIVAGQVTNANIADNTIGGEKIGDYTLNWWDIAQGTIQGWNVAAGTLTGGLIASGTIVGGHIAAGTITADKLYVTSLAALSANLGTVTAGAITGVSIYGNSISGNSISGGTIDGVTITGTTINGGQINGSNISAGGGNVTMGPSGFYVSGSQGSGSVHIGGVDIYGDCCSMSLNSSVYTMGFAEIRGDLNAKANVHFTGQYFDVSNEINSSGRMMANGEFLIADGHRFSWNPPYVNQAQMHYSNSCGCVGTVASSVRYKQNIRPWAPADPLAILAVPLVMYDLKAQPLAGIGVQPNILGMLAEDLVKVAPEVVILDRSNEPQAISSDGLSTYMLAAMRALRDRVSKQDAQIAELERKIAALAAGRNDR